MIHLEFPSPTPASRVRHHGAHHWHAKSYSTWLETARWIAAAHGPRTPLVGPVALAVVVVGNRPKTRPDWADLEKWKDGIRLWRPVRPDDDNYGKAVRDAMNSRIFVDDSQIVASLAYKVVAANGEATKVLVWCGPIEEETVIFAHCKGGLGRIL